MLELFQHNAHAIVQGRQIDTGAGQRESILIERLVPPAQRKECVAPIRVHTIMIGF